MDATNLKKIIEKFKLSRVILYRMSLVDFLNIYHVKISYVSFVKTNLLPKPKVIRIKAENKNGTVFAFFDPFKKRYQ